MTTTLDALDPRTSQVLRDELPGLEAAFDEALMRQCLQAALLGDRHPDYAIARCDREQAVFVPDQGCVVRYAIEVRDREGRLVTPALVSVRLFASARSAREHLDSCLRPLAASMRGRDEVAAFATPVALLESLCMTASLFPIDSDLPTLVGATDPAAMLEVLRGTLDVANGQPFVPTRCGVEVAHYPRQHHCVLRYALANGDESHRLIVYGKIAGDDRGAVTMAAVSELRAGVKRGRTRPFTIPRALGLVEPLRLVLLEAIAGAPRISQLLKQRLLGGAEAEGTTTLEQSIDWAATVAAGLHTSGVTHGRLRRAEDELNEMRQGLSVLERVSPVLGGEFRHWLDAVTASAAAAGPWPLCFSHGDFSPSQILFSGDQCALIDFDTLCQAEPMLDLGQFLSYLRLTARKAGGAKTTEGRELTERLCARFVEAYIADSGLGPQEARRLRKRVPPYEMLSLLRLVVHSWRKFKSDRLELAVGVVRERLPSLTPGDGINTPGRSMLEGLWRLNDLPDWLRPERLKHAMEQAIPEFASGALTLQEVRPKRIHLKDGYHGGTFKLAIVGPGEARRVVNLLGRLDRTGSAGLVTNGSGVRFAEAGWRGALPELGLVLEAPPADTTLPAQSMLTDAGRARVLLENGIRTGSPRHADIHIERCSPHVARHNPGSRITVVYRLEYGPGAAGRDWPRVVVAKTHRGEKGRVAYESMSALWNSQLRSGAVVTLAEPLAYLPELQVLIQGGVPGESTLGDLLETVLLHGTGKPAEREQLHDYLAKAARGLAALHGCGARGEPYAWEQEMAEVCERIGRLAKWIPGFEAALAPALARIEELADSHPAQRAVPSHRSFRPAQVLLHEGRIAFIDFDGFCEAEPATDLSLFRASMKQNVLRAAEREDRTELSPLRLADMLTRLDELCDLFLNEYERLAPVSRERVELWETLYLVENLLNTWEKVRPEHLRSSMALLEHHLRQSRLPLL